MTNKRKVGLIICSMILVSILAIKNLYPQTGSFLDRSLRVGLAKEELGKGNLEKNFSLGPKTDPKDRNLIKANEGNKEDFKEQKQDLLSEKNEDGDRIYDRDKTKNKEPKEEKDLEEFRAAWISSVYNLDWPSKKGLAVGEQKQEFISLLDGLKEAGLNSVIVQVKPSADSFYPSKYAPWSEYLTGVQGRDPGYNPLAFMIEETHKRNMEFHAWFNPYRVSVRDSVEELDRDHPARKNPDWLVEYGGRLYYNPGLPEVRQFVIDSILEVVKDYNIDGVHLDDYFYPYPEKDLDFPDEELYRKSKSLKGETRKQWRRNNINDFIEGLYKSIKREKPNVKFGVSPFGIWRNKTDDSRGSNTRGGATSYDSLYADTKLWVEKGWLDYIAPQIYWHFAYDRADYGQLVDWWVDVTKAYKTQLYIGHAAYKIEEGDTAWGDPIEIINQIEYNRNSPHIKGSIFFRAKSIVDNPLGFTDRLKNSLYKEEAKTP